MKCFKIPALKSLVNAILLNKGHGSKSRGVVFVILPCVAPAAAKPKC
jgi:hypothetical protein